MLGILNENLPCGNTFLLPALKKYTETDTKVFLFSLTLFDF